MLAIVKYPLAVVDITEAAVFLSEHAGIDIAIRFIELCDQAFVQLASTPGIGVLREVPGFPGARTWRVRPHQHMIVYRATETTLEIIRILHGARDIDAILDFPSPKE
jgi:toxin ParE1/3/4